MMRVAAPSSVSRVNVHDPRVGADGERWRVGQVIAVIRAVRRVQVDHHVRIPVVQQLHERARLGGLELHEVAIEIETVGVFARADAAERTELLRAMVEADALVAVRVVERRDDHDDARQHRSQIADREPPGDDERGFLPFHLARVDVGQHEHARAARCGAPRPHRRRPAMPARPSAADVLPPTGRSASRARSDWRRPGRSARGRRQPRGWSPRTRWPQPASAGRAVFPRGRRRPRTDHHHPESHQSHAKSSHRTTSLTQPIG